MNKKSETKDKRRWIIIVCFSFLVFVVFGIALFTIQIVHGADYSAAHDALSVNSVTVEGARGEILDTNGNPLVTNRQGNNIIFDGSYFPSAKNQAERNNVIISLIRLFEQNGVAWTDNLPITLDASGTPVFKDDSDSDITYLKSKDYLHLNDYATAENCFDALVTRYEVEDYSKQDQIKIISVCYNMKKLLFTSSNPYTFAEDVPDTLVAKIKENSDVFQGVDVNIVTYREYVNGTLAPHILGYVDKITAEEYDEKKEALTEKLADKTLTEEQKTEINSVFSYGLNDKIGQFGIESAMEEYLRGKDGTRTTTVDANGGKTTEYTKTPTQGDTVILTIDSTLQKIAQDALATRISALPYNAYLPAAGAVVAIDVNSGAVLACATYPTFDLNSYKADYSALSSNAASPLWNRCLQNTYAPGSTFKPAIACAGLETGVITPSTTVHCTGTYQYLDQTFQCLDGTAHGTVNVVEALNKSCNIFFYETGRKLGIDTMNTYCKLFGFGEKTGVELPEASGILASVEYRESQGGTWYPGDTIQAAIGQSDNLFTPVQLASYTATIANGGTRYKAHFVKSVKSYDFTNTVIDNTTPTVLNETGISQSTFATVKEGMRKVGERNKILSSCPVAVAAKTGTAQIKKVVKGVQVKGTNGLLISFAPYDNPQVAIAIIVENAETGSSTAQIAADIYTAYFSATGQADTVQSYNTLLN